MPEKIRILGIDPGTRYTGIGIIDRFGNQLKHIYSDTIITVKEKNLEEKLFLIFNGIKAVIEEFKPDAAGIEKIFHSVNVHSSLILGHARGVAMLGVRSHNIVLREFAPTEVKSAVVGVGRAGKDQVAAMVRILLNLDRQKKMREDESDALAIAICFANTLNYQNYKVASVTKSISNK
jgi:crossover junction endodeoxyribonuclease RuvC